MTNFIACMGGFKCSKRESCANYHATNRSEPSERLCLPGQDGAPKDVRIVVQPNQIDGNEVPA